MSLDKVGETSPQLCVLQLLTIVDLAVSQALVSRAADDALSAAAMVELGFLAMAQAWPLICRQKGSNSEQTILAAGQHLDVQLQDFEKVVKKIMSMAGCATRMAREAESMKKLVNDMVRGIDVLRQSHPQLTPSAEEVIEEDLSSPLTGAEEEDWESEGAEELVAAYNQYLDSQAANSKTHYPKTPSQLQLSTAAESFLKDHPSAFKTVESKVKEQRRLAGASKRRKTAGDA